MSIRPEAWAGVEDVDCSGRSVLVTGSTDGIGEQAAYALARLNATVIVHGRDRGKADSVVSRIEAEGGEATAYTADFSSLDAVREFAASVRADHEHVDVLANNAGTYFGKGRLGETDVEATFVVNHLAPFLLTHLLLPTIPEEGRIVTTASDAHRGASLDLDALDDVSDYDGFRAYSRSKLANVLFTRELARRLDDRTATCFHPGFVPGSALWRDAPSSVRVVMRLLRTLPDSLMARLADTPATGAVTLLYLAVSPDVEGGSGGYYANRERKTPSSAARDDDLARDLWARSEELIGLDPDERLG